MAKETEPVAPVTSEAAVEPIVETVSKNDFAEILDKLLKDKTNRVYRGLMVKNVIKKDGDEDYTRVTLVVSGLIPGYIPQEDGSYKRGTTANIYTTSYAISAVLKQNEDTAMMGNYVVDHPEIIPILLSGATINVVQTDVKEGVEYYNPFTTKENAEPYIGQHDFIVNNIYALKLGKMGMRYIDKLIDKSVESLLNM